MNALYNDFGARRLKTFLALTVACIGFTLASQPYQGAIAQGTVADRAESRMASRTLSADLRHEQKEEASEEINLQVQSVYLVAKENAAREQPVQTGTITGAVTEAETGEPIPGANVMLVGTQRGAATDAEGRYRIDEVEAGTYDVQASFVGYQQQLVEDVEVVEDQTTEVNFALAASAVALDEVVAVGYGTQRRSDVTGSVSSVPLENLESESVIGIDEAITGKVPGVQVTTTTGTPGGGPAVRIRGIGSIGAGNNPLFVVDGTPIPDGPNQRSNPLNSIPPGQIESIEVLKDASATAIYGSRGSNGVILVTTKGGTTDTQIQVNSSVGLQSVRKRGMPDVLNATQWAQFQKERISDQIRYFEGREPTDDDIPEMYRNPDEYGEGTNWPDRVTQDNVMHNHSISFSTGTEVVRARVSADITDQQGTLLETGYRRYALRSNIDANLSDNLEVGLNIAPSLENQNLISTDGERGRGGVYASSFLVNPIEPVTDEEGSVTQMVDGPHMLPYPNPVFQSRAIENSIDRRRVMTSSYAEYQIIEGLDIRSSFSINWMSSTHNRYEPTTVGGGFSYPPQPAEGDYNETSSFYWTNENTIDYRTFFGNHSVEALVGVTFEEETVETGNFFATDYPDDEIRTFNAAQTINGATNISDWGLISTLGRVNYSYNERYLLTATVRRDGSSRFGGENRWGVFPSFSIGWRVSEESFLSDTDAIDNLMVRFGYGRSGNFNIGNYTHLGVVTATDYAVNSDNVAGRSITSLGNTDLGWEEVDQANVGVDLSLFEERLNFVAEYYRKVSSNMLLFVETPFTSGFSGGMDNRGEVTNQGVELGIRSVLVSNQSWNWGVDATFTRNVNEVTELEDAILSPTSTAQHITEEGYPIGMFYGFVVEGFYNSEEEIESHIPNGNAIPGAYRHKDVNGDGRITPVDDFERIGDPHPDFSWSVNSSLSYQNIDFSVSVTGDHGVDKLQTGFEDFHNMDGVFNVSAEALDRWKSPDEPGEGILPRAISTVIHRYNQSVWVRDASNIWIRNITLGYTFSQDGVGYLRSVGANSVRVYLNVNNPWISNTNFQNPDEELFPNNPLRPNETRNLNHPISRTFTLGVNMGF